MNILLYRNVASIHDNLQIYKEGRFCNALYTLKDYLFGSDLTEKRNELASSLIQEMSEFKKSINSSLKPEQIDKKCADLGRLIAAFETKNQELSAQFKKGSSSGRLATHIAEFKEDLSNLKSKSDLEPKPEKNQKLKMIH